MTDPNTLQIVIGLTVLAFIIMIAFIGAFCSPVKGVWQHTVATIAYTTIIYFCLGVIIGFFYFLGWLMNRPYHPFNHFQGFEDAMLWTWQTLYAPLLMWF